MGMSWNYEADKVARTEPKDNNGIGISTAYTPDFGYETALLDQNGTYPVERYETREKAFDGHWRWLEKTLTMKTVIGLGTGDGWIEDEEITLNPYLLEKQRGE